MCRSCSSSNTKKNGRFRGVQRFKCRACGTQFQREKIVVSGEQLWHEYAHDHATARVLKKRYGRSTKWILQRLDAYEPIVVESSPRAMIAIADATRVGIDWVIVIRDPHAQENVHVQPTSHETTSGYQLARKSLEQKGFTFKALVGDGRVATPWLFPDIPIQMCHFHQLQIVIRCTTQNPKLEAGVELLALARTLPRTTGKEFKETFEKFCAKWHSFLQEKTVNPTTGSSHWTHKKLRQARDSIKRHLPFLFTYQKYPELDIPNTTNSLDGSFKKVKTSIGVHAGLSQHRKLKLATTLLRERV